MNAPGYWLCETNGSLRVAVEKYFDGDALSGRELALLRAYLRQWICSSVWSECDEVTALRDMLNSLTSRAQIDLWTSRAWDIGIDPW